MPAASHMQLHPWPKFLPNLRLMSHPEPASQVGKWWQPYPSWSFIWNCLKGTRGSSRSWGVGKDPRSSDAGVSDGCCGHIWNEAKQNSLLFRLATGRFTQIRLNRLMVAAPSQRGNKHFTSGCPTGHMLMVPSPAPEGQGQLLFRLSKAVLHKLKTCQEKDP